MSLSFRAWPAATLLVLACGDDAPASVDASTGSTGDAATGTAGSDPVTTAADDEGSSSGAAVDETTAGDALPPTPVLVSPPDGATDLPIETPLCWTLVDDPDGDAVRYRVFVDDTELTEGMLGETDGWDGPCVGPLTFAHEHSYEWQVEAFEVDAPERTSERSAAWSFSIEQEAGTHVVFEDGFEEDLAWQVDGDGGMGGWIRGDPAGVVLDGVMTQPDRCSAGDGCCFTGDNPGGDPEDGDVDGTTTMISPPFDLSGAAAASVRLRRFFYASGIADEEDGLRVDLLVPWGQAPGGFQPLPLEYLAAPTADDPENLWIPREYVACGVPMLENTRLRITVRDTGDGVVESAIDSVTVLAHAEATICESGEGGACDPALGEAACPEDLSCCPHGSIQAGAHRCSQTVRSLDWDDPPDSPDDPGNGPVGCDAADLVIDPSWIEPVLTDIFVSDATCELLEGCVAGTGWRTVLRFSLAAANVGSSDLVLGVAANEPDVFHWGACHEHFHFDDFAAYELRDESGVVAQGPKLAFCLLDSYSWAWPNEQGTYDCANQGIGRGFADIYESDLPCQWIDVTDVPPGDYTLRATLNVAPDQHALPRLVERDYANNTVDVPVTLE